MGDKEIGVAQLRTNIRLNNRLRLEFHASLSRLLREHGLRVSDSGLSELTLATPRELMGLAGTDVATRLTSMSGEGAPGNGPTGGEGVPDRPPKVPKRGRPTVRPRGARKSRFRRPKVEVGDSQGPNALLLIRGRLWAHPCLRQVR